MKNKSILVFTIIGILFGALWFRFGERFDQSKLEQACWEKLHYMDKERLPLYFVHAKSILAAIVLIVLAATEWKYKNQVIAFIGAAIIGLHVYQFINEQQAIKTNGSKRSL